VHLGSLAGKAQEKLRLNPRKAWYRNLDEVRTKADDEVTFHLKPASDPDCRENRAEARAIMEKLGYGPNKRLAVTVLTRNTAGYRDPAVIAIDQMKEIYLDGTLELIETANWFPKVIRKDYTIGVNVSETEVDDPRPDVLRELRLRFGCNYTAFCDKDFDALIDR
jgi:peptide/nickel transport system substrate-binding protein